MRIGIFGGTFDPVHLGHLILAEQCREQVGLDQVLFIPSARPPHKQERPLTAFHHRAALLALATAGQPAFRVDELERDRPGLSYTVDTLDEIGHRQPDDELYVMLGTDVLPDLGSWREPQAIAARARFLVVVRPGWEAWTEEKLHQAVGLPAETAVWLRVVEAPLVDIASRDLRKRVATGRSIRYLVPRAVEEYVRTHRLYEEPAV